MKDHLLSPWLSSPLFVFLDLMRLSVIIAVPPGLYIECHGGLVSAVVTDASVQCFAIVFRNLPFVRLYFQCVLFSSSMRMLYCWDLLLLHSSLGEWASAPRSKPLALMNSNLVSFGFFAVGKFPNDKFLSSSIVFIRLV